MRSGRNIVRIVAILLMACRGSDPHAAVPDFRLPIWPAHADLPGFDLVDTSGRARTLGDFRGKIAIVFFGFMNCPDFCPAELAKLSTVMKQLGARADAVQVLFITVDPKRDDPADLERYVTYFDPRFIGLTGSTTEINRAAARFHVNYAKLPAAGGYTMSHSTATYVLDRTGRLRLVATMNAKAEDIAHDLAILAAE